MPETNIFISAGEQSGDNAGGLLLSALKSKNNKVTFFGLGGERMRAQGQEQLTDFSRLAVMGFWEVLKHYSFFKKLFHQCLDEIKKRETRCVILIDYPGFNLRLAREVKKLGIPVVYYISPQVWAWGEKRVREIKKNVDKLITILPFEKEFYKLRDVECEFVGHYLLEDIPAEYISSPIPSGGQIGILPGSRPEEIRRLIVPMLDAASEFNREFNTKAVIAGVRGKFDYETLLKSNDYTNVEIVYDNSRRVIYESSVVITKSGTATLETAIIGRPMIVAYKTSWISYLIAVNLVKLDNIALVNLVLGKTVVPELIQSQANAENFYQLLKSYQSGKAFLSNVKNELDRVPGILGGQGASGKAAEIILSQLN